MGMAASQARYLGLTARKTNTEFEGQQVNQQRTALANQSANLFNQLMALEVPNPPSTTDYTKLEYTYSDGLNKEKIDNYTPLKNDANYNYTVTHTHTEATYEGVESIKADPKVTLQSGAYWISNLKTYAYDGTKDAQAVAQIQKDYPTSNIGTADTADIYSYQNSGKTYYTTLVDMQASLNSGTTPQASLPLYYAASINEDIKTTEKAYIETDSTGRLSSITLESTPNTQFSLTTTSTTDTNAYNDAMNNYTYQNQLYQKKVQDINAKTSKIQAEDRELELRLKQLDTEQEALSTELESVKKVIDKNIENTFKTFQ